MFANYLHLKQNMYKFDKKHNAKQYYHQIQNKPEKSQILHEKSQILHHNLVVVTYL